MAKYLDLNGLRTFWNKIKNYVNNEMSSVVKSFAKNDIAFATGGPGDEIDSNKLTFDSNVFERIVGLNNTNTVKLKCGFATASDIGAWNSTGDYAVPTVGLVKLKIDEKYTKPSGGISSEDLAQTVLTSLGKADSALQSDTLSTHLNNYVEKSNTSGLLKNDGTVDENTYLTSVVEIGNTENINNPPQNKFLLITDKPKEVYSNSFNLDITKTGEIYDNTSDIYKLCFLYKPIISLKSGDTIKFRMGTNNTNQSIYYDSSKLYFNIVPAIYTLNSNNEIVETKSLSTFNKTDNAVIETSSESDQNFVCSLTVNNNYDIAYLGVKLYSPFNLTNYSNFDSYWMQYCIKSESEPGLYIKNGNDTIEISGSKSEIRNLLSEILILQETIENLQSRVYNLEN